MRKVFAIVIVLSIFYFLVGWIAVLLGWITNEFYYQYAGIVGSLASVAGLISLTRPSLTNADLQNLEVDSLRTITQKAEELQSLESDRATTQEQIQALDVQKKEMTLLVRKASLALFLRDQYTRHERRIRDEVNASPQLQESLAEVRVISEKLQPSTRRSSKTRM